MFAGVLQKDLFKGRCSLEKILFKQNYCHACHTRFAVFFPLPSGCESSLLDDRSVGSIRLFPMIDYQISANSQHYLLVLIQLIMFLAEEHLSTEVLPL